jgi:hypothetical protein
VTVATIVVDVQVDFFAIEHLIANGPKRKNTQ